MVRRRRARAVAVAATAFVLSTAVACGDDDDTGLTPIASETPDTDAATPGSTATAGTAAATPTGGTTTATPTEASTEPAFDATSSLTIVGLDDVYFGMTPDEAAAAANTTWDGIPEGDEDCYAITPSGGPDGVFFTVYDDRIERVDITNPDLRTRSGAGIGTTEAELTDLFGDRLVVTAGATGNIVEFVPEDDADATHHVIFVTDGTVVTGLRAGRVPQVQPEVPCADG